MNPEKIKNMDPFVHHTAIIETDNIGKGTKIWAFSHVSKGVVIGENCMIGEGVHIGEGVSIGNNCKIQNHSLIYHGVTIEDDVFLGPNTITTNDIYPRAKGNWQDRFRKTLFKKGSSVGANSTIVCGVILGEHCMVAAGSVVSHSVMDYSLVKGSPARHTRFLRSFPFSDEFKSEDGHSGKEPVHKTVFTNGCFDILHFGHFKLLEFCRKKAGSGAVIVGLNSDASVKRNKGESRPFNNQEARKFALESLRFVDDVIIFDEDNPYNLIKRIEPNYIIKGGDYKKEEVVGFGLSEIIIFNTVNGYSTTSIASKIMNEQK